MKIILVVVTFWALVVIAILSGVATIGHQRQERQMSMFTKYIRVFNKVIAPTPEPRYPMGIGQDAPPAITTGSQNVYIGPEIIYTKVTRLENGDILAEGVNMKLGCTVRQTFPKGDATAERWMWEQEHPNRIYRHPR